MVHVEGDVEEEVVVRGGCGLPARVPLALARPGEAADGARVLEAAAVVEHDAPAFHMSLEQGWLMSRLKTMRKLEFLGGLEGSLCMYRRSTFFS